MMITSYQPSSRPVLQSNETSSVSARSNGGEDKQTFELRGPSSEIRPAKLINDNTSTNAEIRVNCQLVFKKSLGCVDGRLGYAA